MEVDQFRVRYRVKTVTDGWNNKLTMHEAAENGVIDINRNQYINKKTGEQCSVMEAIKRGYIVQLTPMERIAELRQGAEARSVRRMSSFARVTTTGVSTTEDLPSDEPQQGRLTRSYSLRETGSNGSTSKRRNKPINSVVGCFYGLISFKHCVRTVKYAIEKAKDMRSGDMWAFERAKVRGVLDVQKQTFKDTKDGRTMTFNEAIEQNLIEIRIKSGEVETIEQDEAAEYDHFVVYGVMDLLEQRRITFKEALENFVLVRSPPVYRDTLNHVDLDLHDAISQRLVVAKQLEANSLSLYDRMISEDNRLESVREKKVYEYDG